MSEAAFFVFNGLVLRVYPKAYLVEVRRQDDSREPENRLSDLPDWVFRSRRAIWLTLESGSMLKRAEGGERIKKELLSILSGDRETTAETRF
jgi:hypothetical protein